MAIWDKLFAKNVKEPETAKEPVDDPADREPYDTAFVTAYKTKEDMLSTYALLRERAKAFPNSRVEARVNPQFEINALRGQMYFPYLLYIFVVFQENFLDPNQARRLRGGAPSPREEGARQGERLAQEIEPTKLLGAFDTPRVDAGLRGAAQAECPPTATFGCPCGEQINVPLQRVSVADGVEMKCASCGDVRLITPSIFDGVRGGALPSDWRGRLLPPLGS
jgi:hypothetical protein